MMVVSSGQWSKLAALAVLLIALSPFVFQSGSAFAQEESYTLMVRTTGGGNVFGPGINCGNGGTDCSETYPVTFQRICEEQICNFEPVYQEVTLTASTPAEWRFQGWGGACSGTQNTCALTMGDNHSVSANWTYPNGRIAFNTGQFSDANYAIRAMNPDGTDTKSLGFGNSPSISPDGTKVAFSSSRDGNYEIYTLNLNGSGLKRLTNDAASDSEPAWSPDGTRIAFSSMRDGNSEIYVMNADGTGQTRLTDYHLLDAAPSFSPDGAKIAFERQVGNREIYVMNADGAGEVRLTTNAVHDNAPDYSPDGTKIVFNSSETDTANTDIYSMNALDGTGRTRLTTGSNDESSPAYAPEGTKIAYVTRHCCPNGISSYEIYSMNANGTAQTRLTNTGTFNLAPDWGSANPIMPNTTIESGPPDFSGSNSATFEFSSDVSGSVFDCQLDGGALQRCDSPRNYANLSQGEHTFSVRAVGPSGNEDPTPATRTFTVDTVPPSLSITSGPAQNSFAASSSATFTFTATDATSGVGSVRCKLDSGAFGACSGTGSHSASGLAEGSHTFTVEATDAAGNVATASRAWIVDTTPPETSITSGPSGFVRSTSATFEWSGSDSPRAELTYSYKLDDGAWSEYSPETSATLSGLSQGAHTIHVRAKDAAGNVDESPATRSFTVDTVAPSGSIKINNGAAATRSLSVRLSLSASDAVSGVSQMCVSNSTRCSAWQPFAKSRTWKLAGNKAGTKTVYVRFKDRAGNVSVLYRDTIRYAPRR